MAAIARIRRPFRSSVSSTPCIPILPLSTRPSWTRRSTQPEPIPTARTFTTSRPRPAKKYTQDHEWIELSADGKTGTIGISTYAAKALGDVVYVELPTGDLEVSKGDTIGAVESVKSASDIMTPVSGKIIEGNSVLEEKPGVINKGPEAEGWIARIEVGEGIEGEVKGLMDEGEYGKFTAE